MRKVPFFLGLLILIFPLNWLRMYAFGEFPPSNDPRIILPLSLVVLVIAALMIWLGLPSVRHSYRQMPASVGGALTRLGTAVRQAREQAQQRRLDEQRRQEEELEQARTGNLVPINPGSVVLQQGEQAFASIPASLLETRTVRYRGRSTGVSVRVAKGVWLRQSGSQGTPEKGLVPVAKGILVATNRRLIFAGDQKSAAVSLAKISSFEPMLDGLRFGDERKTYNFHTEHSRRLRIFSIIAERVLRERS